MQVARLGLAALATLTACTGGESSAGLDPAQPGAAVVAVDGLPDGGHANLTLNGPNGYLKALTGPETVTGLEPGEYSLAATDVTVDGDGYQAAPTTQTFSIRSSSTTSARVGYSIGTGRLALSVDGAPGGVADLLISGPDGSGRTATHADTLRGLSPGGYVVRVRPLVVDGESYAGAADSIVVQVTAGVVPSTASAHYQLATGRIDLTVSDVPAGVTPTITLEGPGGYSAAATGSQLLKGLPPGSYTIHGADLSADGDVYEAVIAPETVTVAAGTTPATAAASYRIKTGSLALTISGLPNGASARVTVTGPGGFQTSVPATTTLRALVPGTYTIAAANVAAGGSTYLPQPTSQTAAVTASKVAVSRSVGYSIGVGSLAIAVNGLGAGVDAAISVTGPNGYSHSVVGTTTLGSLAPGVYTVAASSVTSGGQAYQPSPASQQATVTIGGTTAATVTYTGTKGALTVNISGLPGGSSASVSVSGPGGFNQVLTGTQTLTGLTAGTYTVTAATVVIGPISYLGSPVSQSAVVSGGTTAVKSVAYVATGNLTVTVSGLPGGAAAAITVTGPAGYNHAVTGTVTLTGLVGGTYTVTAASVLSGGTPYQPSPTVQTPAVVGAVTASAPITYTAGAASSLDLVIDGMYLTQAAAKYDGTTPVITGRDGYLRVFVKANQANTATPAVRVRFYTGATLVQTSTIVAPGTSVPTTINEGSLASSWNVAVPAALVQPGLKILADVDPAGTVAELDETNNSFPAGGTPFAIDVRTVPTWQVRLVPVLQQANGLQGNVTAANMAQFLTDPLKLLPVADYNADVRAVYTTTANGGLQADNTNGAWGTVLSEILNLRTLDASTKYYYGVVKTGYSSGVAGIGYVGGGFLASMGWDNLPSGSGVMAHEVGHNMGRQHSPCGGAASPDPGYPYPGAQIGIYGLDVTTLTVKMPTTNFDFMGYCNPTWVSDYVWSSLISMRQSNPNFAPPAPTTAVAGLLVWGRITSRGIVVEPAFRVAAPSTIPTGSGDYRVEGYAADGRMLFSDPIEPQHTMVYGTQGHEMHFSAVLPLDRTQDQSLARLRLVTPDGPVERLSSQAVAQAGGTLFFRSAGATVTSPSALQATINWDGGTYPMAMVRDATTGQVLSFARGGSATIWTGSRRFDVTFSDGVRSFSQRIQ